MAIRTKSVHEPATRADGRRILVTRFRGRGLPRSAYDVWLPALGPSERLLRAYQRGALSFAQFARAYRAELFSGGAPEAANRTIRNRGQKSLLRLLQALGAEGNLTLLCHCPAAQAHCHLLHRLLAGKPL